MNEVRFKTLRAKNFMSFGNVEQVIDLTAAGTTFIVGENLDEGASSGAGKSTIFTALCYALFDKIIAKVKKERMINRFNDSKKTVMYVELDFEAQGHEWKIRRERGVNTEPRFWEDGVEVTGAALKGVNEKIEVLIGFSFNIFKQIVMFNGKERPFLDMDGGDQRDFIEELIKITRLTQKATALKVQMKDTDSAIKIQIALLEQQKNLNDKLIQKLVVAADKVDQWEMTRDNDVQKLQQQLAESSTLVLPSTQEELDELASLKSDIQQLDSSLKAMQREQQLGQSAETKLASECKHLEDKTCPYCLQGFVSDDKLETALKNLVAERQKLIEIGAEVPVLQLAIAPLKVRYADLSSRVNPVEQARIKALIAGIPVLEERLAARKIAENPHVASLEALASDSETDLDTTELDKLKRLQSHQSMLLKLLTDKNSYIRKGIISKTLPFLNKRIGYYTVRLGLPHIVMFQPDMTVEITQIGRELDHGNLSNGEKVRLNFSLCLAFRDTLTFMRSRVNLLMTDEIDGGSLDEQAVNNMISLLKEKAWDDKINVLVISHRPEFDGKCDRTITIRKEGGFSSIIEGTR